MMSNDNSSESDALYSRVYREIRERICLLDYPPGTLLSENALASEFNVSRPWLRSVLQRLEFERLLSRQSGGGFVVSTDDIKTIKEAFFLRIRLYELIADGSPRVHIRQSDLDEFEGFLIRLEKLRHSPNLREYGQVHMAYHEHFMKFVQNSFLRDFINQLYYQTVRVWIRLLPDMSWDEEMETSAAEMRQAFQALKADNLAEAALARREYLSIFVARLMDYLGEARLRTPESNSGWTANSVT